MSDVRGYIAPEVAATAFMKVLQEQHFSLTCKILDVGAGTGLVAQHLKKHGFSNIDALDSSAEMLSVARENSLYTNYIQGELGPGRRVGIETRAYDCAISVGLFTIAHVRGEGAMDEIARVVRKGGLVCFTVREDAMEQEECYGYETKMKELCDRGAWKLLSVTKETYHEKSDHLKCFLYLYQIL